MRINLYKALQAVALPGLVFLSGIVSGQVLPQNKLVSIPPTPQAASLFKFVEIPVSENTGIPNISIPVYNISLKSFSFPITLKYHSSGVKVEEQSGNIGLGWALEAGGTISSSVNDLPDFSVNSPYGDFPQDRELKPEKTLQQNGSYQENADYTQLMALMGNPKFYNNSSSQGQRADLQPDIFFYSMFEKSGKFFFNKNGLARPMPYNNLLIERRSSGTPGYEIKDERGVVYIYDVAEQSNVSTTTFSNHPDMGGGGSIVINFSYHLSRIVTPAKDTLSITYQTQNYSYINTPSYSRYKTLPGQMVCVNIEGETRTETNTSVSGKFIDEIITNRGHRVKFVYGSCQRLDMPGTYPLQQIDIYEDGKVRSVALEQEYFGLSSFNCNTQIPSSSVRLKLKRIKENLKGDYVFDYEESVSMPDRFNQATDHWGYYNGSGGTFPADPQFGFYTGGDKSPNLVYAKTGVLKKMTYPTGGNTVFEYESNRYPDEVTIPDPNGGIKGVSVYGESSAPEPIHKYVQFTIPDNVEPGSILAFYECTNGTFDPQFSVSLYNSGYVYNRSFGGVSPNTGELLNLYPGPYTIEVYQYGSFESGNFRLIWREKNGGTTVIRDVDGGGLRIKTIKDYDSGAATPAMTRRYTYNKSSNPSLSSGQIFNKPLYSTIYEKKNYAINPDNNSILNETICRYYLQSSKSKLPLSGSQSGNVVYTEVQKYVEGPEGQSEGYTNNTYSFEKDLKPYYMYPFTPPTSYEWMSGYLTKSETYVKDGTIYRLRRRTSNTYNFNYTPPDYSQNPSESGAHYTPPSKPNENHALGLNVIVERPEYELMGKSYRVYPALFTIESFKLISTWVYLQNTVEEIMEGHGATITNVTNNYYDNPLHAQLTRVNTSASKGGFKGKLFTYAHDYPAGIGFIDGLKQSNLVTLPIESISYEITKDNAMNILSGEVSEYQIDGKGLLENKYQWENNRSVSLSGFKISNAVAGSIATPGNFSTYAKDARYVKRINVPTYDDANNILQVNTLLATPAMNTESSRKTAYQWGYQKQHVVAEINNASVSEFFYEGFEDKGTSGIAHTGKKFWNGAYKVSWTKPNSRNYELSYWYLNNNVWSYKKELYVNNSVDLSGGIAYDDIRICPVDAQMSTYTYIPMVGISSITDSKGETSYYEYDALQRLKVIKDQNGNIIKSFDYHYKP